MAVVRKEREFNGGGRITGSKTLREAIDVFLAERSVQQDVKTFSEEPRRHRASKAQRAAQVPRETRGLLQ
jgi:hypothetical protein